MKRKLLILLTQILLVCVLALTFTACSSSTPPSKQTITGITFTSATYDYDGTEKELLVSGTLPEGVSVVYSNNSATNAGQYNASAILSGDGYNNLMLNATLTINKAQITGITVEENQSFTHDGQYHLPFFVGNLPTGVTVKYEFNGKPEEQGVQAVGDYSVKIIFSGENYVEKSFNCSLKIKINLLGLAETVINAFGSVPSPWSFLPESFSPENRAVTQIVDYSDFVNVSSIPKNGIGKQLNVVYGLLNKTSTALSYVSPVYGVMNIVKSLYTSFLDNNPEDYKNFSGTAGGINFTLAITETQYLINASVNSVGVTIYADTACNTFGAKIQLTETTVLKYTVSENGLIVAMDVLDTSTVQIDFARNENAVIGMVYEYLYLGEKEITATSAMIAIDDTYTTLIGTKGDFIPTSVSRNCEVYRNSDGHLVGTEVREEMEIGGFTDTYNTLWYNLYSINGINTIKKVDKMNGTNADTIYINGSSDTIHTKLVGGISKKLASRRFDIEFKTMYFYQYDQAKEEYVEVSMEIPMMFVQEENSNDFEEDFYDKNKSALTSSGITLTATVAEKQAVTFGYYTLLVEYDKLKDAVSHLDITNYCKQ